MKPIKHISLKQLIANNKYYLFLGVILLIINKAATMLIPYTSKPLMDDVIKNGNVSLLKNIILIILISLIVQAITSFGLVQVLSVKAQKKIAEIRTQFFNKLTHLPISYFKNSGTGELVSRTLDDFESIRVFLGAGFAQLIGGIISTIFAISLMFFLNVKLSLYVLAPIAVFCIIIYFIYKKQKPAFKNRKEIRANVSSNLIEAYRNIKVLKGFGSNDYSTSLIKKGFFDLFESIKITLTSTNLIISLGIIFIGFTSIIIMWFGGNMAISNEITIGELTTFTIYLAFLIAPIYQITKISSQFIDASASIERINETLKLDNENSNDEGKAIIPSGQILFDNVSFKYGDITVLNEITFEIKPNSINALVGKSGAGKSTLTDLIAGFYQPNSGSILIDDNELSTINLNTYRQYLGFVFQESFLFNGSIKENVLLAKPTATANEVETALTNANVTEFSSKLPQGINTIIGEGGSKLSEGQKQRIAIARAFLVNPKVLILDEATSNLDANNEKLISESISQLMENRTIIIISHQLKSIKDVDQIIMLENGKISGKGTHEELIEKNEKYYNLYNS